MLATSYNPGYQTVLKDLKQSAKQRFITIEFAQGVSTKKIPLSLHKREGDFENTSVSRS